MQFKTLILIRWESTAQISMRLTEINFIQMTVPKKKHFWINWTHLWIVRMSEHSICIAKAIKKTASNNNSSLVKKKTKMNKTPPILDKFLLRIRKLMIMGKLTSFMNNRDNLRKWFFKKMARYSEHMVQLISRKWNYKTWRSTKARTPPKNLSTRNI